MIKASLTLILGTLLASTIAAQPYSVELDLDGTLGNGPDVINAQPGDTLAVNVWCTGEGYELVGFGIALCSDPNILGYSAFQVGLGGCWSYSLPVDLGDGCRQASVLNGCFEDEPPPLFFGTAYYAVTTDNTCDWVQVDSMNSGWLNSEFVSGSFQSNVPAAVLVNTTEDCLSTATETTHWGAVKTLFR